MFPVPQNHLLPLWNFSNRFLGQSQLRAPGNTASERCGATNSKPSLDTQNFKPVLMLTCTASYVPSPRHFGSHSASSLTFPACSVQFPAIICSNFTMPLFDSPRRSPYSESFLERRLPNCGAPLETAFRCWRNVCLRAHFNVTR